MRTAIYTHGRAPNGWTQETSSALLEQRARLARKVHRVCKALLEQRVLSARLEQLALRGRKELKVTKATQAPLGVRVFPEPLAQLARLAQPAQRVQLVQSARKVQRERPEQPALLVPKGTLELLDQQGRPVRRVLKA